MKSKKFIIGTAVCVICLSIAILCLFMPIKANESVTLPAVVIRKGDSQAEHTTMTIDGTWMHTLAAPSHQSFAGKIQIDMLEYTHKEDTWDLDFQVMDDASDDHLIGGLFYNSGSGFDGYGWLYTDKNHNGYVLVTSQFDKQDDDYIVIAPADTEEAARYICDILGLHYLQE